MQKESFILYTEQKEIIDKLSDEQAGKLIKAIYEYIETETMPQLESPLDIILIPFKQSLDRNNNKWEETKQKRSEAGKIGAKKRWQKPISSNEKIANIANAINVNGKNNKAKNEMAKMAVNVNDNVHVNVNDNVNVVDIYNADAAKINNAFIETIGSTNINNIQECISYLDKLPFDVIEYALKKTARKGAKWDYAITILDSYVDKNINTLEKIEADEIEFKNNTGKNEIKKETQEEKTKRKIKELEEHFNANK